jgi:hypothetical protein
MTVPVLAPEEAIAPFREARESVPMATHFRSTWLSTSMRGLRERGLLDRYLATLPKVHHDAVLNSIAGIWLPIDVATAHYRALDALALPAVEIIEMGREAGQRAQGSVVATAARAARRSMGPWAVLVQLPKIWDRMWVGGGAAVFKLAERDARVEVIRWPCASVGYCRVGLRGVVEGWAEIAGMRVTVAEVSSQCTATSLMYRVQWA